MCKYFYLTLIGLSLFFANDASAASNAQQNTNSSKSQTEIGLTLTADQYSETLKNDTLAKWISSTNTFSLSPTAKIEFENSNYCPVNKIFCALTLSNIQRSKIHLAYQNNTDTAAIKSYVEELAQKVNRQPQEAKFKVENGKVATFAEATYGIALNVDESVTLITKFLNETDPNTNSKIELPFEKKETTSDYADINNLGISDLIGEGTSNFQGSTVNRIKNIKVAVSRFNGVLIKPGEEFSFVKTLGDVDQQHGYFPELVIKKGITEPEFGGGVCQVSTTVFRAAIYSGLKITARRNHAYPVSYYNPQGMDSTVYVPNPDLKFINNTPSYILVQAKIEGTRLTFNFYGTNDGRKTTVDGPRIIEKQPDGALKATFTQYVADKDGNELINDTFNSSYASPYKYPHPGGPVLSVKPSNWSEDEWKAYKKTIKEMNKADAKQ